MSMVKERIHYVDLLRGMAMLLVILGHCIGYIENPINRAILSFHMPLFFFISGITYKESDTDKFLYNKVKKLLIPLLLFYAVNLFIKVVLEVLFTNEMCLKVYGIIQLKGFWFPEAVFVINIAYLFMNRLLCKWYYKVTVVVFLVGIASIVASCYSEVNNNSIIWCFGLLFFGCGHYYASKLHNKLDEVKNKYIAFGIIGEILLVITYVLAGLNRPVEMYCNKYGNVLIFLVTSILGISGCLFISLAINKSRLLEYFGKNTLIILVTHFGIVGILTKLFEITIGHNGISIVLSFIVTCLIESLIILICNKKLKIFLGEVDF